jgi:acyl-CoA thioesterase
MADAFPPAVFGLLGMVGWVPTIELTVHLRARPAPGWLLGRFHADDLSEGRVIEHGALWDSRGRLVAQSRQLALVRNA